MGQVIQLRRRTPKPRSRRVSVTLSGEFGERVQASATRAGIPVSALMRFCTSVVLDDHDERVREALERRETK